MTFEINNIKGNLVKVYHLYIHRKSKFSVQIIEPIFSAWFFNVNMCAVDGTDDAGESELLIKF